MTLRSVEPIQTDEGTTPLDGTEEAAEASPPPASRRKGHWAVSMNHRNRTTAFLIGFFALALHLYPEAPSALTWIALTAQFLVYPHLAFVRAQRSAAPMGTELQHVTFDSLAFGFWAGFLSFPVWITFIFLVGTLMNPAAFQGVRGLVRGAGAFLLGAVAGQALGGVRFAPHTGFSVTALCIASVLVYLVASALGSYRRTTELQEARDRLRTREQLLSEQLSEIRALETQLREQALRDPLTGLYNRRFLMPTLARELARCRRAELPLCVMLIDVDHFKRINDTFGHDGGDAVLRNLGAHLTRTLRAADVVCRFGGEEFVLVLPEMPASSAKDRAETVRRSWEAVTVTHGGHEIRSTLSVGIAALPEHGQTEEELLKSADLALYEAKRMGRNRVVVAGAEPR